MEHNSVTQEKFKKFTQATNSKKLSELNSGGPTKATL